MRLDASGHCLQQAPTEFLRRVLQEQPHDGVLHLRQGIGEVDAVTQLSLPVALIGQPLRQENKDRRQVLGKDLGMNVL